MQKIIKPQTDTREYTHLTLPNGIRAIVAHDPSSSSMAAAAVAVLAGSVHEPKEVSGLAHFCEHMLLHGTHAAMSTQESNFAEYVKQHGGSHNGVTTMQQTCFVFDIQSAKLVGALRRFARLFKAPEFNRTSASYEIKAIESEHSMNKQNDFRRQWAILLLDANPHHPYHWGSGCQKSLVSDAKAKGIDAHVALANFHSTNYLPGRMAIAVVGMQDTPTLLQLVSDHFGAIPSGPHSDSEPAGIGDAVGGSQPAFLAQDFRGQVYVAPVKDIKQFRLAWLLPWQVAFWRTKPTSFTTYILGHEGPGSVLSALKARGLATNVFATCFDYHGVASTLEVAVDLTEGSTGKDAVKEAILI